MNLAAELVLSKSTVDTANWCVNGVHSSCRRKVSSVVWRREMQEDTERETCSADSMHNCRLLCNRIYPLQWIISPSVKSWDKKSSPLHMNAADMFAGSTHVYGNMTSMIRGGRDGGFSVEGKTFVICVNTQIMSGMWSWLPFCVRYIYIFSLILTAQHNGLKKRGWLCVASVYVVQPTDLRWLWSTCSYCRWCWYSRWSQHSAAGQGESKWFILLHLAADLVFSVRVMFRLHFSNCMNPQLFREKINMEVKLCPAGGTCWRSARWLSATLGLVWCLVIIYMKVLVVSVINPL